MSLRARVYQGGAFLAFRQVLALVISFGGTLLLTRALGPAEYGGYAAAIGLFLYLQSLCQWGIGTHLVRQEHEQPARYAQAFWLLMLLGTAGALGAWALMPLLTQWMRMPDVVPLGRALCVGLPLALAAQVPMAMLERRLDYKRVAGLELSGLGLYYALALPLAFAGRGAWAPLVGWWCQQVFMAVALFAVARFQPRWHWEPALIREMIRDGLGFSASIWVWQLRSLVNPLVVGRFAGAEAVGYVALAIRLVDSLSFVKQAVWRLSLSVLSRFQGAPARMREAVNEGMHLQVLALGPLMVGVSWGAPWLFTWIFGPQWAPAAAVFPFVALGALANAVFNLHSSALYALRRNWEVTHFHAAHVAVFALVAWLGVPRLGLAGYGWAEAAAIGAYVVIHAAVARHIGSPAYALTARWWAVFSLALFVPTWGALVALPLVLVACLPSSYRDVFASLRSFQKVSHAQSAAA